MQMFLRSFLLVVCLFASGCSTNVHTHITEDTGAEFKWDYASPEEVGVSSESINMLVADLFKRGTKKLLIIKDDKIIVERFASGWHDSLKTHYSASLAKALVGGISLSAAMDDGLIHPDAPAFHFIPQWSHAHQKSKITIRHLATHTSGLEDAEASPEEKVLMEKKKLDRHMDLPGWKGQFWRQQPDPFTVARDSAEVRSRPGMEFQYSNPGIGMLTYAVTTSLKNTPYRDIRTYLHERIYDPIGIAKSEYAIGYGETFNVDSLRLVASWGGGNFTADAIARLGRLMLRQGNWQGTQVLDSSVVRQSVAYAGTALPSRQRINNADRSLRLEENPAPASTLGWYSNFDGNWEFVPRDAFCGAGAGNQILVVIPSLNLIVVRMGGNLFDESKHETFWGSTEKYLLNPLMDAITEPPYPKSDLRAEFAPASEVIRMAQGGDSWPMTWGDNDTLYTAYGDGWGFDPKTKEKLSLGLAKISGYPPAIKGENIRSQSGERVGEGPHGQKASGILMVDGVLYMWVRNMNNSQLARSSDHGETWTWADWKFEQSFGCPNFINYGKDYADAPDEFVYAYSLDERSAYDLSDRIVLARVAKNRIMDWRAYEFFAGTDSKEIPQWSEDIRKRKPVFSNPAKCYRTAMTYCPELKRYLWCQTIPRATKEVALGPRFSGGLGIFESPYPWGPWKTVFYTRQWDMGPSESGSIPGKWMGEDGKTFYYVFSGDDSFSVRKLVLEFNK
jgi:CubicO group peptidase (beta-lactamase class C family)